MGECRGSWVVSRTGRAPSNIAVIKYWGKRNEKLILPVNSSISVTLNPEDLSATTTVAVSPSFSSDRLWLNDKEVSVDTERYQNCLREMRARARDMVDEKTGVTITKADWKDLKLHIASRNNFPTAAGLASSAAGFACLVYTIAQLMAVEETYEGELSAIARLGSGSACRSLYGGYVKWNMGTQDDGRDSIASQIAKHTAWDDLRIIIAVVSSKQKEVSSTSGMQDTVKTSSLLSYRAKEVVPKRMEAMEQAILNHDFHTFARITCADSNQFHATCLDTSPPVFYLNDTSRKIINLVERWNQFEGTPQVAYTFDAGPNAVLFVRERSAKCLLQRLLYQFPPPPGTDMSSYVVGDRKLLASSGIRSSKDVEHLLPPPELTNQSLLSRKEGEIAYLISTSPGEGPYLLQDPATILIDPNTVLPLCS